MAFKGRDPVRIKMVMNNNIIGKPTLQITQVALFHTGSKKDITVRVSKFLHITGIINRISKPSQIQKHTKLKTCNTLALPTILHRWET